MTIGNEHPGGITVEMGVKWFVWMKHKQLGYDAQTLCVTQNPLYLGERSRDTLTRESWAVQRWRPILARIENIFIFTRGCSLEMSDDCFGKRW